MRQPRNIARVIAIVCVLSACGSSVSSDVTSTSEVDTEPVASEQATPDFATMESEYLPVLAEVGDPTGGGSIGAFPGDLRVENGELVLEVTYSAGCGSFHHFALVETAVAGTYEVFHDTDNNCEAAALDSFKVAPSDLVAAEDGTVTIGQQSIALPPS